MSDDVGAVFRHFRSGPSSSPNFSHSADLSLESPQTPWLSEGPATQPKHQARKESPRTWQGSDAKMVQFNFDALAPLFFFPLVRVTYDRRGFASAGALRSSRWVWVMDVAVINITDGEN